MIDSTNDIADSLEAVVAEQFGEMVTPSAEEAVELCNSASVHIVGGLDGVLIIDCCDEFLKKTAALLLELEEADVGTQDALEAWAEVANVFGGNLKGLSSEASHLTLPIVSVGGAMKMPGVTRVVYRVFRGWGDAKMSISVYRNSASDTEAAA